MISVNGVPFSGGPLPPPGTAGQVLTLDSGLAPEWAAAAGGTHGSGTLAARPASPSAGDTYAVTSGAGAGDKYTCALAGAWTLLPGDRSTSPDGLDSLHWRLDETSGVYVSTGVLPSVDLTVSGSPVSRSALSYAGGTSLDVSAASARGAAGDLGVSTAPTSLSVSAWIRPRSLPTYGTIVFCDYGSAGADPFGLSVDVTSTGLRLLLVKSGAYQQRTITTAVPSGIWHHTGIEYTSSVCKTYVDGTLVDTWTPTGGAALDLGSGSRWVVGDKPGIGSNAFDGAIADVRIYEGARAAAWWREVYLRGTGIYQGA